MTEPMLEVTDALVAGEAQAIAEGLNGFNDEVTGFNDRRPLAVVARDPETGKVLGGVTGRTSLGLLFIDIFYLPRHLRGAGLGTRLLQMAEEEGRRRGCRAGVLLTISFQAPEFYRRHGWRVFGEIPCNPPGTSRIYLTKDL
jgi:GNAT superfamily N-acetyltransferase